ncbi:N-acetylglucosaminyl-phosphatidylinositol de-N-acetylase [Monosporozyma unispora]
MARLDCSKIIYKITKLTLLIWITYIILSTTKIPNFTTENLQRLIVKSNKIHSVTLVIAHPDDEVMFFAPTLLNLNEMVPKDVSFNVVCYSNGDAEGLGDIRALELQHSIKLLLSQRITNTTILDHKDGMDEVWDAGKMLSQLNNIIPTSLPKGRQNIVLTFDKDGVSNHINHKKCFEVASKYHSNNMKSTLLLTLNSYHNNILLKYSSFGWECLKLLNKLYNPFISKQVSPFKSNGHFTVFSTYPQYILSLSSMLNAHKSQMVWYRYFWWVMSRFVFVNNIKIVN